MIDVGSFQDLMWAVFTSGLFLLFFSVPRFIVHGGTRKNLLDLEMDPIARKKVLTESWGIFWEDAGEMIIAATLMLFADSLLARYLDLGTLIVIYIVSGLGIISIFLAWPRWAPALGQPSPRRMDMAKIVLKAVMINVGLLAASVLLAFLIVNLNLNF